MAAGLVAKKAQRLILFLTICLLLSSAVLAQDPPDLPILGLVEKVRLYPGNILIHAKLDTGADYCSIHASNIYLFPRKKKQWVRFDIENRFGQTRTFELPVHRTAKIKRTGGLPQARYVVQFYICIGSTLMRTDVNLVDRSNFAYTMLVGRNFLSGNALIDPSSTYLTEPNCSDTADIQ